MRKKQKRVFFFKYYVRTWKLRITKTRETSLLSNIPGINATNIQRIQAWKALFLSMFIYRKYRKSLVWVSILIFDNRALLTANDEIAEVAKVN